MACTKEIEDVVEPPRYLRHGTLASCYPEVAVYWYSAKNCGFGPDDFGPSSDVRVWWHCVNDKNHTFKQLIGSRVLAHKTGSKVNGCTYCRGFTAAPSNSLASYPELVKEWMAEKNEKKAHEIVAGSNIHYWWRCSSCKGEWQASPEKRAHQDRGCPFCVGRQVSDDNSLAALYPEVAKQWHPRKNGSLTPHDVTAHSGVRVWWQCEVDTTHVWQNKLQSRTSMNTGCPYCRNLKLAWSNCLQRCYPSVATEWHPVKNGDISPRDVVANTTKEHWWKCNRGHSWKAPVRRRTIDGANCPICKQK
jgi:hypothetical protein